MVVLIVLLTEAEGGSATCPREGSHSLRAELGFKPFDLQPRAPDQSSPHSTHFQLYFVSSPHLLCHPGSLMLWQLSHGKFCSSWIFTFFPTSCPTLPPSETEGPENMHLRSPHPACTPSHMCVSPASCIYKRGSVLGSSDLVASGILRGGSGHMFLPLSLLVIPGDVHARPFLHYVENDMEDDIAGNKTLLSFSLAGHHHLSSSRWKSQTDEKFSLEIRLRETLSSHFLFPMGSQQWLYLLCGPRSHGTGPAFILGSSNIPCPRGCSRFLLFIHL